MMSSPFSDIETMFSAWPTATSPSERATIATCAVAPPSSSTMARSRVRSYSSSSAGPMLRATRTAFSGSSLRRRRSCRRRSARAAAGWRGRRGRAAGRGYRDRSERCMRARVSFCTRSTAASAVRPLRTASLQPVDPAAIIGEHPVALEDFAVIATSAACRRGRACRRSTPASSPSRRRGAWFPASVSSAMKLVTTTRGSCSTTCPSAMPSVKLAPMKVRGRRRSMS